MRASLALVFLLVREAATYAAEPWQQAGRASNSEPELCQATECPQILQEIHIPGFDYPLRRYSTSPWARFETKNKKFVSTSEGAFLDSFIKAIKFQQGDNYLGSAVPITTPLVVEVTPREISKADHSRGKKKLFGTAGKVGPHHEYEGHTKFNYGFNLFFRLHSTVQDDDSLQPTYEDASLVDWSPSNTSDWLAVISWEDPTGLTTAAFNDNLYTPMYMKLVDSLVELTTSRGFEPFYPTLAYFAIYGSPVDRRYEAWVPLSERVVERLRSS